MEAVILSKVMIKMLTYGTGFYKLKLIGLKRVYCGCLFCCDALEDFVVAAVMVCSTVADT